MAQRNVLVTGGMGGLGESICTKMADAGYRVLVTYSPGNTKAPDWLASMKARGYEFQGLSVRRRRLRFVRSGNKEDRGGTRTDRCTGQ